MLHFHVISANAQNASEGFGYCLILAVQREDNYQILQNSLGCEVTRRVKEAYSVVFAVLS